MLARGEADAGIDDDGWEAHAMQKSLTVQGLEKILAGVEALVSRWLEDSGSMVSCSNMQRTRERDETGKEEGKEGGSARGGSGISGLLQRAGRCSGGWSLGRSRLQERGDGQRSSDMSDGAIEGRHYCGLDEWIGWRQKTRTVVGEDLDRGDVVG